MASANSTIKGYLYQFNKSIYEILASEEGHIIELESIYEDIDIISNGEYKAIQCKYHEDKKFSYSNILGPILEMMCTYSNNILVGKILKFVLYAYYIDNKEITKEYIIDSINKTKNKDYIVKYLSQLYKIEDDSINTLILKSKKTDVEKNIIKNYIIDNRSKLEFKVSIDEFWNCFKYEHADNYKELHGSIIVFLCKHTDENTAKDLYYPNSLTIIAELSSNTSIEKRKITKKELLSKLDNQKSFLMSKWALIEKNEDKIFKDKKRALTVSLGQNSRIRCYVISNKFYTDNESYILSFIRDYLHKYNKKPKLAIPPIFILDLEDNHKYNNVINKLFQLNITVNAGLVGSDFNGEAFISNSNCAEDFRLKMALKRDLTNEIINKLRIDDIYYIGSLEDSYSLNTVMNVEKLEVKSIDEIKYLLDLSKSRR